MSLENEIKKLREAIEENTAVLLGSQTPCTSGCVKAETTPAVPQVAEVPANVPPVPSAPAAVQPSPVPTAPVPVPTPAAQPAAVQPVPVAPPVQQPVSVVSKEQVNETLQAKAAAMGDGGAAIFAVLQEQFQAANVSSLDPSRYADLITVVNGLGA